MPHPVTMELVEALPAEIEAGAEVPISLRVSCARGCDLRTATLAVTAGDDERASHEGAAGNGTTEGAATRALVLVAPVRVGPATWTIAFPPQDVGGCSHGAAELVVTSEVVPHGTSVAIWGVPSPEKGSDFTVRVGIKCSVACSLSGERVEVLDDAGRSLGDGALGDAPRPGTDGLYEAEIRLTAPSEAGVVAASVRFAATASGTPHSGATGAFTFRVVEPPEHTVTVRVAPEGVEADLEGIEVRVGPYGAFTDEHGVARVRTAPGGHELSVWRIDIEPVSKTIEVVGDEEVHVRVGPRKVVDEDEERVWA